MAAGLLARAAISDAQQAGRTWQLGILMSGPPPSSDNPYLDALKQGLNEHGYAQGRNLSYVIRAAGGRSDRLPKLAAELVQLKVDAVVTIGSEATRAAVAQAHSIPIVFVGPSHPVEEGLVASLAHPGGNVTGLTSQQSDIIAKTLQLLVDLLPAMSDVAVVWNPSIPSSALLLRDVESAAVRMRLRITRVTMAKEDEVAPVLATIARAPRRCPGSVVSSHDERGASDRRIRGQAPSSHHQHERCRRETWVSYLLWPELPRSRAKSRWISGQDLQRREARRSARGTADEVRVGDQPENRKGARPRRPAVAVAARG